MMRLALAAALLITATTGFILVPEQAPGTIETYDPAASCPKVSVNDDGCPSAAAIAAAMRSTGLSRTAYDALRIATWVFLIVGLLVVLSWAVTQTK